MMLTAFLTCVDTGWKAVGFHRRVVEVLRTFCGLCAGQDRAMSVRRPTARRRRRRCPSRPPERPLHVLPQDGAGSLAARRFGAAASVQVAVDAGAAGPDVVHAVGGAGVGGFLSVAE